MFISWRKGDIVQSTIRSYVPLFEELSTTSPDSESDSLGEKEIMEVFLDFLG